ncbi:alpha/beta fold hydrolase [Actinokineospora sp. HUAS TT18]|uniref:alpha/beta fold hydrolase n=1 Tax=Actinokineospora sp. HUAS TT18 TaxID=3447451 RepID=UPI003F51FC87
MRACAPTADGTVVHDGVKLHYDVYGAGETILLLPTWTAVHQRCWKLQIPYLARHFRVVTYDGPGNGDADRPLTADPYGQAAQVAYALAVLDATETERAVVVGLSRAANWALGLAAAHPSRVAGLVAISPALVLGKLEPWDLDARSDLPPSDVRLGGRDPRSHWGKYTRAYWLEHYDDFLWFFFGQCFSEPHSTKQIEDCVGWGHETDGAVLVAESHAPRPGKESVEEWMAKVDCPLLAIHGTEDGLVPTDRSEKLVARTGGELALLRGAGHLPHARDPVRVNLLIKDFAERISS